MKIERCSRCGGKSEPVWVGDWNQYVIYRCSECRWTPFKNGDVASCKAVAIARWNRYTREDLNNEKRN